MLTEGFAEQGVFEILDALSPCGKRKEGSHHLVSGPMALDDRILH